jgi:carbamoyl-phosphate synthase large subunit
LQFYQDAKSGLPIIETSDSIDDIKSGKYVVKERYGAGSDKIGINLNKDEAIGHSKKLNNPIYQPFIPGQEYSVDIFIDKDKNTKGVITRKRELVVNGESQITTTKTLPEVENVAREFINSKNFYGHVILQLIIDENNQIQIIECNPRFGGASSLSINSGLDSFYWFLLESNMVNISSYPFVRAKKEIKQIRFPEDIIIVE